MRYLLSFWKVYCGELCGSESGSAVSGWLGTESLGKLQTSRALEPLDPHTWFSVAGRLYEDICNAGDEVDTERWLRRAFYISQLTPPPLDRAFSTGATEDQFEALLEGVSFGRAAKLLADNLKLVVERAGVDIRASVVSSDLAVSGSYVATSQGLAVLGAWLDCIAIFEEALRAAEPINPSQHKSQLEPHRT